MYMKVVSDDDRGLLVDLNHQPGLLRLSTVNKNNDDSGRCTIKRYTTTSEKNSGSTQLSRRLFLCQVITYTLGLPF